MLKKWFLFFYLRASLAGGFGIFTFLMQFEEFLSFCIMMIGFLLSLFLITQSEALNKE